MANGTLHTTAEASILGYGEARVRASIRVRVRVRVMARVRVTVMVQVTVGVMISIRVRVTIRDRLWSGIGLWSGLGLRLRSGEEGSGSGLDLGFLLTLAFADQNLNPYLNPDPGPNPTGVLGTNLCTHTLISPCAQAPIHPCYHILIHSYTYIPISIHTCW